jgi:hypothetical protein
MATNGIQDRYVRHYTVAIGILVSFVVCEALLSQAQVYVMKVPEYRGSVKLSGNAAVVAADHLAKVVRLLQNGGPSPRLSEAEAATWTVENEIKLNNPKGGYSKVQYLADYRAEFLKKWQTQLEEYVEESPQGSFRLRQGSSYCSHNIATTGGSNGYWDATLVVNGLKDCTKDDGRMIRSGADGSERHATPTSDAFIWIYQNVPEKSLRSTSDRAQNDVKPKP